MNKTVFIIMFASSLIFSQPSGLAGKKEVSVAFTYQRDKAQGARDANWFMSLPLKYMYHISNNIGLGGELVFSDSKLQENVASIVSGLVEANWPRPMGWNIIPFITAGYGYSNGSFPVDRVAVKAFNSINVGVLNFGGGIKVPVSEQVLVRGEYRYQNFSGKGTEVSSRGFSEDVDVDINYSFFWIGFSVLL